MNLVPLHTGSEHVSAKMRTRLECLWISMGCTGVYVCLYAYGCYVLVLRFSLLSPVSCELYVKMCEKSALWQNFVNLY